MVVCSSLRRAVTSAFIWRCRDGSSGKGYRLALNASQICTDSRKSQADSTLGTSPLQQQHAAKRTAEAVQVTCMALVDPEGAKEYGPTKRMCPLPHAWYMCTKGADAEPPLQSHRPSILACSLVNDAGAHMY